MVNFFKSNCSLSSLHNTTQVSAQFSSVFFHSFSLLSLSNFVRFFFPGYCNSTFPGYINTMDSLWADQLDAIPYSHFCMNLNKWHVTCLELQT